MFKNDYEENNNTFTGKKKEKDIYKYIREQKVIEKGWRGGEIQEIYLY